MSRAHKLYGKTAKFIGFPVCKPTSKLSEKNI